MLACLHDIFGNSIADVKSVQALLLALDRFQCIASFFVDVVLISRFIVDKALCNLEKHRSAILTENKSFTEVTSVITWIKNAHHILQSSDKRVNLFDDKSHFMIRCETSCKLHWCDDLRNRVKHRIGAVWQQALEIFKLLCIASYHDPCVETSQKF